MNNSKSSAMPIRRSNNITIGAAGGMGSIQQPQSGIAGVVGGIQTLGQLKQILAPAFAPASTTTVPQQKSSATGKRQVNRPTQTTILQMLNGGCSWIFPTPFTQKPSVQVTMEGAPSSGTPSIYITLQQTGTTYTGVLVTSSLTTDARYAHVAAIGNPN